MSGIRLSQKHGVNPTIVVCLFCERDTGDLALVGRLPNDAQAPMRTALDYEPCDRCKAEWAAGIALVEHDDTHPTGRFMVVSREAAGRMLQPSEVRDKVLAIGKAFMDVQTFTTLVDGLPK